MTNEDFERTKEFILKQQAQFTSDIQELREAQGRTEQVLIQTGEIVARLAKATLEGFKDVNSKINALVDSQLRTDEKTNSHLSFQIQTDGKINALVHSQMQTDEKINALLSSQMRTDEKINLLADSQMQTGEALRNLAAVVDRHISEGRNGNNLGT